MASIRYGALLISDDPLLTGLARSAADECRNELDLTVIEGVDAALAWLSSGDAEKEPLPNIILSDLKLPKLDGLAVIRTIRKHPALRDIPITVFSTEYTQEEVLMSYQAGANSFVAKPADSVQFRDLFREQLAYWMGSQQRDKPTASKEDIAGRI